MTKVVACHLVSDAVRFVRGELFRRSSVQATFTCKRQEEEALVLVSHNKQNVERDCTIPEAWLTAPVLQRREIRQVPPASPDLPSKPAKAPAS